MTNRYVVTVFSWFISQSLLIFGGDSAAVQPLPQATLTTPTSWQYGRTLAECNQYMLDHQLATDIGFHVGSRDQARSLIRAHRYVLMSRSDVFTRLLQQNNAINKDLLPVHSSSDNNSMIQGGGHSMQTIDIPDMDPAVFKQLLNYIYTDNATLDLHNVIPLMYSAKRFQLPKLITLCQEVLQRNISMENVCIILNQAVYFHEEHLINKSLAFIGGNAEQVLFSDEVLHLSREALKVLISYDRLDVNETLVFETSMRWVKAQMSANNLTTTDGAGNFEITRRMLGDILFRIRFPVMQLKEFAELAGVGDLLTCEEKASIYYYIATSDHMNHTLKFGWEKRERKRILNRFDSFLNSQWGCAQTVEKIQLTVSKSIILKAVGTYGVIYQNQNNFADSTTISLHLSQSRQRYGSGHPEQNIVELQGYKLNYTGQGQQRDYIHEIPIPGGGIKLEPNYFYTISLQLALTGYNRYHGYNGHICFAGHGRNGRGNSIKNDGVVFTFNGAGTSNDQNQGQFPRLYYYE